MAQQRSDRRSSMPYWLVSGPPSVSAASQVLAQVFLRDVLFVRGMMQLI